MRCDGTLWFHCSDEPYLDFRMGAMEWMIPFRSFTYHVPADTTLLLVGDGETKDELADTVELYRPAMPHCRTWIFRQPDSKLTLDFNCGEFRLAYGTGRQAAVALQLTDEEARQVAAVMDATLARAVRDGDVQAGPEAVIDFGLGMCAQYRTRTWHSLPRGP